MKHDVKGGPNHYFHDPDCTVHGKEPQQPRCYCSDPEDQELMLVCKKCGEVV